MTQLSIRGHATRGKEVIQLLEMLGGKNKISPDGTKMFNGTNLDMYYTIEEDNYIHIRLGSRKGDYIKFILEEFLEKFPYKVGDKVVWSHDNKIWETGSIEWDEEKGQVLYVLYRDEMFAHVYAEELQPYKEETIKTITIDDFKANTKEWLIDKLHDMIISDAIKTIGNIHDELHKPKYPKDFKECFEVLMCKSDFSDFALVLTKLSINKDEESDLCISVEPPHIYSINVFYKLLICRDAYWKTAGEQMGLGKPWRPDWRKADERKYCIVNTEGNIAKWIQKTTNKILAFPTEEMRDAFYENFKNEIEQCKELL